MRKYEQNYHNVIIDKPLLRVVLAVRGSLELRGFPKKAVKVFKQEKSRQLCKPSTSSRVGLHNCLEFSQPLSCLYQAMQTQEKSFLLLL